MTTTATHTHDISVSISAGDVPAELMAALAQELLQRAEAIIEDWMKDSDLDEWMVAELATLRPVLHADIDYDGRRECDLPHPVRQP